MKKSPHLFPTLYLLILLSSICFAAKAQLSVVADQPQALYQPGDLMNFTVVSNGSGPATYSIRYDRFTAPLASGVIDLVAGVPANISFSLPVPGMVLCWVTQNGQLSTGGAIFAPFDQTPFETPPADLISFWDNLKSQLAIIPPDPQISFEEDHDYSTTYRINLASIDNRRVYGYLSIPDGEGPFPASLELPPYGSGPNVASDDHHTAERTGTLAMSISIHNAQPDEVDPNAYQPDIIDDPSMMYYRYAILGAIRAIDYLVSRDDFDGENLAVMGVSQGGGLALMVAGLDDRVTLMANSNPALCEHAGFHYDRASGFPYYLKKSSDEIGTAEHFNATLEATKYYDAVHLAPHFAGPSLTFIGYRDTICPPATSYAAFNQLPGPKILVQAREVEHHHPAEYQVGRFDMFRRYFPSTQNPPWPWPDTTTGYFIDAGTDETIDFGESLALNGIVEKNGSLSGNWTLHWRAIEGPGNVIFDDVAINDPEVNFEEPGSYRIEFRATEQATSDPDKFFTAIDYIDVEVLETVGNQESTHKKSEILVYSNPSDGEFQLTATGPKIEGLMVYDVSGNTIFQQDISGGARTCTLDLRQQASGVYWVDLRLEGQTRELVRLIKQ